MAIGSRLQGIGTPGDGAQPAHLMVMSRQISERTAELLPQTQVVVLPGVNHALPLQDPEAVAQVIASFVARCGP